MYFIFAKFFFNFSNKIYQLFEKFGIDLIQNQNEYLSVS